MKTFSEFLNEQVDIELTEAVEVEVEGLFEDEDLTQLDELSKATLGSYIKKASSQEFSHGYNAAKEGTKGNITKMLRLSDKSDKRRAGLTKAVNKLTKEAVESFIQSEEYAQLDELAKEVIGRYLTKTTEAQ